MAAVFGACQVGPVPFGIGYGSVFGNFDIVREIPLSAPTGPEGSASFGTVTVVAITGYGESNMFSSIVMIVPLGEVSVVTYGGLFGSNLIFAAGDAFSVSFGQISMVTPQWR